MKIAFYSTKPYDKIYFEPMSKDYDIDIHFLKFPVVRKRFCLRKVMTHFVFL